MDIVSENQQRGTDSWKISSPANNHEIEGYASATSVNQGENIIFYVNTLTPSFRIDFFRLGWYNGFGGRQMMSKKDLKGVVQQPTYNFNQQLRMVECNWQPSYTLSIPNEWTTGVYLAKLTGSISNRGNGTPEQNYESYIIFVVLIFLLHK